MQRIGVRDFKNKATSLLASDETLIIERHGKVIGFYVPLAAKDRAAGRAALDRLGETVEAILDRTGMTEDELVAALTVNDDDR
jgi:antitoxin (DNA-binding transcriptional repressor) of toxin-antitoxin stability system